MADSSERTRILAAPRLFYLIDFQAGINLARAGKDIVYLIRGNGIQAAAEGIELNQVQIVPGAHKGGGSIKPGMIHPLVGDDQRPFRMPEVGNGIFRQYGQAVGR